MRAEVQWAAQHLPNIPRAEFAVDARDSNVLYVGADGGAAQGERGLKRFGGSAAKMGLPRRHRK